MWGPQVFKDLKYARQAVFFVCFFFITFKTNPHLLQLSRRTLQCCFAVKTTKLNFPSTLGGVYNS